ncbi:uncharacterized protein [Argopecten irradians]|uniref:uncharacterized protein n=1 Tax=Argopecten irradians TaxID=31199 RepID=UPI0037102F5D
MTLLIYRCHALFGQLFMFSVCFVSRLQGIKIVSFNAGLSDSVPAYDTRRLPVIQSIRHIDYDVMCLQEVYYGNDLISIKNSLGSDITSLYMPLTQERDNNGQKTAPCAAAARNGVLRCMFTICGNVSVGEFIDCAFSTCRIGLESQSCITCLALDNRSMRTRCILDPGAINLPGIMLISKRKVFSVQYKMFEDPSLKLLLPRGYISAKISGIGTVICTHQTAFLGPVYYEYTLREQNIYSNWAEQNLAESRHLTALAKSSGRSPVIVGDLNTSPNVSSLIAATLLQASYQLYTNEGFTSPYIDIDGRCTYCVENSVRDIQSNAVYDNVLIKPGSHVVNTCRRGLAAERILEEIIPGTPYSRSDHFGVRVDIVPLRRRKDLRYLGLKYNG